MAERTNRKLRMAGIKQLLLICLMLSIQMVLFFVSAGHAVGLRPWVFFGASFLHYSVSTAIQYRLSPRLLVQRLKRRREGSKLWDEVLMRVSNLMVLVAVPVTAGLDAGRFRWTDLDPFFIVLGFLLFIISTVIINWAMIANPYFEQTVRIQKDRGHKVITRGPYNIVRHPGYLAGILFALSIPLIIGSAFAFLPVGLYCLLMVTRTLLEDRTLQKELEGYKEYTRHVRHRLVPGIW